MLDTRNAAIAAPAVRPMMTVNPITGDPATTLGFASGTETTLSSFGSITDGALPPPGSALVQDANGALYGETYYGGGAPGCTFGCGTVFKLTPPAAGQTNWTRTTIHVFTAGPADGDLPFGGLTIGAGNVLYGTTEYGGSSLQCTSGCGTVFSLTPPAPGKNTWTEAILHNFTATPGDGSVPASKLVADASGALYGTTAYGGNSLQCTTGCGTVYKLTPPAWTETIVYNFKAGPNDGNTPHAGLLIKSGAIYGTTAYGGNSLTLCTYGCGTVFKLTPPKWTETIVHNFTADPGDGAIPGTGELIADTAGALYGTAEYGGSSSNCTTGCGIVFKLTPPAAGKKIWPETILHTFTAIPDGSIPYSGLFLYRGALYGTTAFGGTSQSCTTGCGTVYKLVPTGSAWSEVVIHNFTAAPSDGAIPAGMLTAGLKGALYGTAEYGGASTNCTTGCGTAFEVLP